MRVAHWRGYAWVLVTAFVGLYVFGVPASTLLIAAIVLACPLMMLVMHRTHTAPGQGSIPAADQPDSLATPERR